MNRKEKRAKQEGKGGAHGITKKRLKRCLFCAPRTVENIIIHPLPPHCGPVHFLLCRSTFDPATCAAETFAEATPSQAQSTSTIVRT